MKNILAVSLAVASLSLYSSVSIASGEGFYVAEDDCLDHEAGGTNVCTPGAAGVVTGAELGSAIPNIVDGVDAAIYAEQTAIAGNNILIGNGGSMGIAYSDTFGTVNPGSNVGIGAETQMFGGGNVSYGSFGRVNGMFSSAIGQGAQVGDVNQSGTAGFVLRGTALGAYSSVLSDYSTALGAGSTATGYSSVALGAGTVASEDYTVAVGGRRVTGLSNAVNYSDAVTLGQMQAITDAMAIDISNLDQRITVLEGGTSGGGTGGTGGGSTVDQSYVDNSSATTLNSANSYTDARYDQAVKEAVQESKAYTDREIAKTEKFLSAGIAAVAAQPMLPSMQEGQKAVAVGTGHYNGANAVGISFGYAPRSNIVISGGVSGVSGEGKPVFRTSASYVW